MPNVELTKAEDGLLNVAPLSDEELDAAFSFLIDAHENGHAPARLLLAVSGGADSLALMILCHEWVERNHLPVQLFVASVDHRLRPQAGDECAYVGALARQLGLGHATLVWEEEKSHSNIQGLARDARYRLLTDHALSIRCRHIAIAHHQDDQAETLLMRLIRGSGVTGLAAMRPVQPFGAVALVRPLMAFPKARLKVSLMARSVGWIEDPSNQSRSYLRVRVRSLLPLLAEEGCDSARLAATARRLQRADLALDAIALKFAQANVGIGPGHSLCFPAALFTGETEEIRLRLLRLMISFVAGPSYPPREEKLMLLDADICASCHDGEGFKRTMAGCCFELTGQGLWVYREQGRQRAQMLLPLGEVVNWLGLYRVKLTRRGGQGDAGLSNQPVLRPLGEDGRRFLAREGHLFSAGLGRGDSASLDDLSCPDMPRGVVEALPSIWQDDRLLWVADWPKVDQTGDFCVECEEKHSNFRANETIE
nr:tRNA lysidine(34) synthetase TilS [uncultured Cohaesibacter sp.]